MACALAFDNRPSGSQGRRLTTSYPDWVGEVDIALVMELAESLGRLLFSFEPEHDDAGIEGTVAVYTDALERVLGAQKVLYESLM